MYCGGFRLRWRFVIALLSGLSNGYRPVCLRLAVHMSPSSLILPAREDTSPFLSFFPQATPCAHVCASMYTQLFCCNVPHWLHLLLTLDCTHHEGTQGFDSWLHELFLWDALHDAQGLLGSTSLFPTGQQLFCAGIFVRPVLGRLL